MEFTLKRILFTDDGVLGVLVCNNEPVCLTLEQEWKNNAKGISCIPEGSYLCQLGDHPKHGRTYEVLDVPGRSAILIHSGNTEADTQGCILVGKEYGKIDAIDPDKGVTEKQLAVLNSKEAFADFMALTNGSASFALHVKGVL
jgi:hypothetical protein